MDDAEDFAIKFEGQLIASTFSSTRGHKITLIIHPNDILESESHGPRKNSENARVRNMATKIGTRYQLVAVELSEETDHAVMSSDAREGAKSVSVAGMMCRNEKFQMWIMENYPELSSVIEVQVVKEEHGSFSEEYAAAALRSICGISSRSELKENEIARMKLEKMRTRFMGR